MPNQRPIGVWLVTIYAAFNALMTISGSLLLITGNAAPPEQQADFFRGLGLIDYILSLSFHACIVLGGVYLFLLRKLALGLFVAGAAFNLAQTILHILTHRFMAGVGGQSPLAWMELGMAWAIIIAAIIYIARLSRKGTLV